jgi:hypothetical protein
MNYALFSSHNYTQSRVITRLAVIWPCQQAQYEPGRTVHISIIICKRANMDRANMTSYLPVFYFQTYSGDDCRHRFLNITTVLLPASSLHKKIPVLG